MIKIGRYQKPLAVQKGNLTVEQQQKKQLAEDIVTTGKEELKKVPTWLVDAVAKKEYKRLIKELQEIDIIGNLDINNLGGYCNAYAFYIRATQQLKNQPLVIEKALPNGSYVKAENPILKIQKMYAEEMRKFASLCGLTIDSRLKVATTKISGLEEQITNEFGDI